MKFIIVGLHSSGKHDIANKLDEMGLKYGKLFSNADLNSNHPNNIYNRDGFEVYTNNDIDEIFENKAYIFMHDHRDSGLTDSIKTFEGLSKYTYDNNDVFVLSPDQLLSISETNIPKDAVYILIDNTLSKRKEYYRYQKYEYDFTFRERLETADIKEYIRTLYNIAGDKVLYFTNEEQERIVAIIYALYHHQELIPIFIKNFN